MESSGGLLKHKTQLPVKIYIWAFALGEMLFVLGTIVSNGNLLGAQSENILRGERSILDPLQNNKSSRPDVIELYRFFDEGGPLLVAEVEAEGGY